MPTYEYLCQGSQHRFEVFQRMSDDPLKECPSCASEVRRVIYPAGVIFKGSGFYVTDSRKSANGNGSSGDGEAKASTEKSTEQTGDSSASSSAPEKKESGGGAKEATASAA
jgi:putative FmdB family regulatory protein